MSDTDTAIAARPAKTPVLAGYEPNQSTLDEARFPDGAWRPHWADFVQKLEEMGAAEMATRWQQAQRTIRENGVTYNVYGDPRGLDRPWELDPIPFLLSAEQWTEIERGVIQRARLIEKVLADIYGDQTLLEAGRIPPAAIYNNAAFLRAAHGVPPVGGRSLFLYAADLVRDVDGRWCVLADKTNPLSGAGYALENRIVVSRALPAIYRDCRAHRLAEFFAKVKDLLLRISPRQAGDTRVVLLSPGPYDRTYFEHVYLARYLNLTLVESADLTARDDQVYLKTLRGLYPVDVILSRLPDNLLDPLEFDGDSTHGVPGLMRVVRAGRVAVANPIGTTAIESRAFTPLLPELSRQLLGEELLLPSDRPPKLSTAPSWIDGKLVSRHLIIRTYAVATEDGFAVMPGGLSRTSSLPDPAMILTQRDQKSKDTWVLAEGPVSNFSLMRPSTAPVPLIRGGYYLPSRIADNLFWLGRYVERAEGQVRLLRFFFACVGDESDPHRLSELPALLDGFRHFFECAETAKQLLIPENLERVLLTLTFNRAQEGGLRNAVSHLEQTAWRVRDRLNADAWRTITNLDTELDSASLPMPAADVLDILQRILTPLEAFSGLIQESMTRGQGWHFLDLGRRVERAYYATTLLRHSLAAATPDELSELESVLTLGVSLMTYRSRYQTTLQAAPVIDLLLNDETNPRSVAFQLAAMEEHVRMVGDPGAAVIVRDEHERLVLESLTRVRLSDPNALAELDAKGRRTKLLDLLETLNDMLPAFSDALTRAYFAHGQSPMTLERPGLT